MGPNDCGSSVAQPAPTEERNRIRSKQSCPNQSRPNLSCPLSRLRPRVGGRQSLPYRGTESRPLETIPSQCSCPVPRLRPQAYLPYQRNEFRPLEAVPSHNQSRPDLNQSRPVPLRRAATRLIFARRRAIHLYRKKEPHPAGDLFLSAVGSIPWRRLSDGSSALKGRPGAHRSRGGEDPLSPFSHKISIHPRSVSARRRALSNTGVPAGATRPCHPPPLFRALASSVIRRRAADSSVARPLGWSPTRPSDEFSRY